MVLLFAMTLAMITYLDRVAFAQAKPEIAREFALSNTQMGLLMSAFGWAYMLFEIPGGWLADRQGPRRLLTRVVVAWSFFTAATGWAWSFGSLWVTRFLFGAGEAGCFPGITRMLANWFPPADRVPAQSWVWASARWGGAVTPILVVAMIQWTGSWRRAFVVFGLVGVAWAAWFWTRFRDRPAGCVDVATQSPEDPTPGLADRRPPTRAVFLLCAQYALLSVGFWFYTNWLPTYLRQGRGFDFDERTAAVLSGLPLLLAGASCLAARPLLGWIARRGIEPALARKRLAIVAFAGAGCCILGSLLAGHPLMTVALLALALVCNDLTMPGTWACVMDLGGRRVGALAGTMNMAGSAGGMLSPALVGWLLDVTGQRWAIPLLVIAGCYLLGALCWAAFPVTPATDDTL
jgi:MFS transporter, ACS family, glucarate transporter